jgi:hypothetical protein
MSLVVLVLLVPVERLTPMFDSVGQTVLEYFVYPLVESGHPRIEIAIIL